MAESGLGGQFRFSATMHGVNCRNATKNVLVQPRTRSCMDSVWTQALNGASRAVGTHHGPTRTRLQATPSEGRYLRIDRHLRIDRQPHSPSGTTAGRRELLGMGAAAASAGAEGPSQGLRAGRRRERTEAGVPRCERTTRLRTRADDRDSEPDYLLRPTRHGPGGLLTVNVSGSFYHWSIHRIWGQ